MARSARCRPRSTTSRWRDQAQSIAAVLLHMLVEEDEVVEHPHHRTLGDEGYLLMDRHAGRTVEAVHFEDAARLLGKCRGARRDSGQPQGHCKRAKARLHFVWPPWPVERLPDPPL